jgi:hypothetical protein
VPRIRHHQAFTQEWFRRNLSRLCRAFNAPLVGRWLRRGLCLRRDGRVVDVRPECVVIEISPNRFEYTGWTGDVVSQHVYEAAKPLWWAIHYWDEWIADRWLPELSYGFDTLTEFTRIASSTTRAFDLFIEAQASSFSLARSAPTVVADNAVFTVWETFSLDFPVPVQSYAERVGVSDHRIARGFLHFDTSAIAGVNKQNIPGTVVIDSASVICVGNNAIADPSSIARGLYLTQSTIAPSRTSTTVVGSDFRQTPVPSGPQFVIGTSPLQLANQPAPFQLIPGQPTGTIPNAYYWEFQESALAEIEAYYYPANPPGSVGAHNGLARFCLRHTLDVNNNPPSVNYTSLELIRSRESADPQLQQSLTNNVRYSPRLTVNYTVGIVLNLFSLPEQGKLSEVFKPQILSPREVRPIGFRPYTTEANRFGSFSIQPRDITLELRSLVNPTPRFGNFFVPVVFAQGITPSVQFGRPSFQTPVTLVGIASTVTFGQPYITTETSIPLLVRSLNNQIGVNGQLRQIFGLPFIESGDRVARMIGIPPGTRFGSRWYVGQAFPDSVYIARLIDNPVAFQQVTHELEDGRVNMNVQVCGVRSWRIEYDGISEDELAVLVQHFRDVKGRVGRFPFYHRRDDVVYEDCYYTAFDIPSRIKKWANAVSITIERQE